MNKILIFYASYGGGHLNAAKSIYECITTNYPKYDVEMIDCMKYVNKTIEKITTAAYREAAKKMPILYASNMSLGIAILNKAIKLVASTLRDFDIEIVETHHHFKKDSPSGTALKLAKSCAEARNLDLDKVRISGRNGNIGARSKDEIGVMALRGGDVAGIHNVGFYGEGEYLEFIHTATSRVTFAQGAIKAALWLKNQPSGLYSIEDSLNIG